MFGTVVVFNITVVVVFWSGITTLVIWVDYVVVYIDYVVVWIGWLVNTLNSWVFATGV